MLGTLISLATVASKNGGGIRTARVTQGSELDIRTRQGPAATVCLISPHLI